jgi:hypothetical protein
MVRKNLKHIVMYQRRINSFEAIIADYVGVVILITLYTASSVIMFKLFFVYFAVAYIYLQIYFLSGKSYIFLQIFMGV